MNGYNQYGYQPQQAWAPQRPQYQDFNFQIPQQLPYQQPQPMQYQAPEPVQQMPQAMPVTLQNVVDMMGQMLQELAAIREAMKHE